jgi:ubiquinone/menaquinone biosynthesis C-methylase UbiE
MKELNYAQHMDFVGHRLFNEVYPFVAEHIITKYGISKGWCLDAGSGPGFLAIALANCTELKIVSLDINPQMTAIAKNNIEEAGLRETVLPLTADVHHLPLAVDFFDLIVSRGSIFFWENRAKALVELHRVLRPEGVIFCGGGMGSKEIKEKIKTRIRQEEEFKEILPLWQREDKQKNEIDLEHDLLRTGLNGSLTHECSGIWLEIFK